MIDLNIYYEGPRIALKGFGGHVNQADEPIVSQHLAGAIEVIIFENLQLRIRIIMKNIIMYL